MVKRGIRTAAGMAAALASITPAPGIAIVAIPPILVGPPAIMTGGQCRVSVARPGGTGAGTAIPFSTLRLGAPVIRTMTSFTTGGGGTSSNMVAAQRKAAGLPYAPQTINPQSATPPTVYAMDRSAAATTWLPYQRLPLTASKGVAEPFGLIFAQAASPTRGRIAALTLSIAKRPTAAPRLRLTIDGPPERGCRPLTIRVYASAMLATALQRLSSVGKCNWTNLAACTRAQWPRGRVLFVSGQQGPTYEHRWIDYDLLADWRFPRARVPRSR